jgi:hypothetical protein
MLFFVRNLEKETSVRVLSKLKSIFSRFTSYFQVQLPRTESQMAYSVSPHDHIRNYIEKNSQQQLPNASDSRGEQ